MAVEVCPNIFVLIINVNRLNSPVIRHGLLDFIKKKKGERAPIINFKNEKETVL